MPRETVVRLVATSRERQASQEIIRYLEHRLGEARRGELIGLATVELYENGYDTSLLGAVKARPMIARAMVLDLFDRLTELVLGRRRR